MSRVGSLPRSLSHLIFGVAAQDAGVRAAGVQRACGHERADVHPHAVVDVRVPADRLLVQWLPAHEDVVGRLAFEDLDELGLQMLGGGEARICAFDAGLLIGALAVDPVAEIGVDQLLQRPPAFAVRRGEAVVVDQRMEAVAPPVPDVPDERALMEQLAMLREETVAQPVIERLAGEADVGEQARELRGRPLGAEGVGEERVQACSAGGSPLSAVRQTMPSSSACCLKSVWARAPGSHETRTCLARPLDSRASRATATCSGSAASSRIAR